MLAYLQPDEKPQVLFNTTTASPQLINDYVYTRTVAADSCDPTDCSPPGSSDHGIFQARIWSGLPFSTPGDLPEPGMEPLFLVSCIGRGISPGKPQLKNTHLLISNIWSSELIFL